MIEKQERRILQLLLTSPTTEFSYREIERRTGISIGTVSKYAKALHKKNLIKMRTLPRSYLIKANLDSKLVRQLKVSFNLETLFESGLVEFLSRRLRPDAIVLFGSYSKGEDIEESDIDLAVIGGRDVKTDLFRFEKILERRISITSIHDLYKARKEFINTLANGIVLEGYMEVVL